MSDCPSFSLGRALWHTQKRSQFSPYAFFSSYFFLFFVSFSLSIIKFYIKINKMHLCHLICMYLIFIYSKCNFCTQNGEINAISTSDIQATKYIEELKWFRLHLKMTTEQNEIERASKRLENVQAKTKRMNENPLQAHFASELNTPPDPVHNKVTTNNFKVFGEK